MRLTYLATASGPTVRRAMARGLLGQMRQPDAGNAVEARVWAADNGCFASTWDPDRWLAWLDAQPRSAIWAVVPDVVADHGGTLYRWHTWAPIVAELGFRPAFVAQDGAEPDTIPDDAGALFVGGSTGWKLDAAARAVVEEAKRRAIPTHMGRVNTRNRLLLAESWGIETVDGTLLAFGPDRNLARLLRWLEVANAPRLIDLDGDEEGAA